MVGWLLSGLLCYAVGRSVARPLLDRWLGAERFERTEAMIERGGVTLLIAVRLIPIVPFSLVSYAAGAARVPLWRFAWTTAVGYLPITALSVYFGTRLEGLSLTDPLVLGSAAALLALLLGGHWIMRRQARRSSRREPRPTRLTRKRKVAGVLSTLPAASTRLDPHHVAADPETPDQALRAEADEAAVDPAGEVDAGSSEPKRKTALALRLRVRTSCAGA